MTSLKNILISCRFAPFLQERTGNNNKKVSNKKTWNMQPSHKNAKIFSFFSAAFSQSFKKKCKNVYIYKNLQPFSVPLFIPPVFNVNFKPLFSYQIKGAHFPIFLLKRRKMQNPEPFPTSLSSSSLFFLVFITIIVVAAEEKLYKGNALYHGWIEFEWMNQALKKRGTRRNIFFILSFLLHLIQKNGEGGRLPFYSYFSSPKKKRKKNIYTHAPK